MDVFHLTPGQVFASQFRVVRPLAAGGMGAVYVVEQLSTGKQRALKLMLPTAALDGERRFAQEARTSSLIPSEHVVDVIDAGVDESTGIPWLAMELLSGESLEQYLEKRVYLAAPEVFDVLQQLCHALVAAHDLGVVHRDLKPDNLFLSKSRTGMSSSFLVKVLDFGLAKVVDRASRNTAAMGTPLWMAPEQTEIDAPISCAADVWALGLIAFRMLSGAYYWRSAELGLQPLLRELLIEPLVPASVRAREVGGQAELPAGFDAWFARAVAREPADRFQHAREAWLELAPLLGRAVSVSGPPLSGQPLPVSVPAAASVETAETMGINGPGRAPGTGVAAVSEAPVQTLRGVVGAATEGRPAARSRARLLAVVGALALGGVGAVGYFVFGSGETATEENPRAGTTSPAVIEVAPLPAPEVSASAAVTPKSPPSAPSAEGTSSSEPAEAPPPSPGDSATKALRPTKPKAKPSAPSAPSSAASPGKTLPDLL